MQPTSLILLALAALGTLLLALRHHWPRLRQRTRRLILASAVLAILIFLVGYATHWTTASARLNAAFYWCAIGGYLLLLAVHSLTRPRWLTITTAVVLAAPILAASIMLPLGALFFPSSRRVERLADRTYASWIEFTETGEASSGTDIEVFDRPSLFPFLEHTRFSARFYNVRCNGAATEIVLQPDNQTVYLRCPPWPGSHETNNGEFVSLR